MKATRVKEFIHFGFIPIETKHDGKVYFFMAVDAYSKFTFHLGHEKKLNDETLLKCVNMLINDKDFKAHNTSFTLIMPTVGKHIELLINALIQPSGRVIFDTDLAFREITPIMKTFLKLMDPNN